MLKVKIPFYPRVALAPEKLTQFWLGLCPSSSVLGFPPLALGNCRACPPMVTLANQLPLHTKSNTSSFYPISTVFPVKPQHLTASQWGRSSEASKFSPGRCTLESSLDLRVKRADWVGIWKLRDKALNPLGLRPLSVKSTTAGRDLPKVQSDLFSDSFVDAKRSPDLWKIYFIFKPPCVVLRGFIKESPYSIISTLVLF